MPQLIKKYINFVLKIIRKILHIAPKYIYLNNIQCKKHLVFHNEIFSMPELKDIFGNKHYYFNEYKAQTPDFYILELHNAFLKTGREEVWTSKKELILDHTTQKQNPMYNSFINFKKAQRIKGSVVNLCLDGVENNYYHWLTECLGRLYILKAAGIEPDYYIVRNSLSFQKQWLELFGITQEKIVGLSDTGNEDQLITVDTLLITTFINNWEPIQYIWGYSSYKKIWLPSWIGNQYKEITEIYNTPPPLYTVR
jgi:hypothetical protein